MKTLAEISAASGRATAPHHELWQALTACRHGNCAVAAASALINVLYLTGSFFMLEVYDRVLPSRSIRP